MQSQREDDAPDVGAMGEIRRHVEAAMSIMDSVRPGSAFTARCQEALDGLPEPMKADVNPVVGN
jgi:hypothetical protein